MFLWPESEACRGRGGHAQQQRECRIHSFHGHAGDLCDEYGVLPDVGRADVYISCRLPPND